MNYNKCYVAFMDILGFKDMVESNSLDYLIGVFDELKNRNLMTIKYMDKDIVNPNSVNFKVMSDSLCAFINYNSKNALYNILAWCSTLQKRLIEHNDPILVRGAITLGDLYCKEDVIFGSGLSNSYLMEEKIAKYPRIIISKDLVDDCEIDELHKSRIESITRLEKDYYISTDYLKISDYNEINEVSNLIDRIEDYAYSILNSGEAKYQNESVKGKYMYLLEYLKYHKNSMQ